MVSLTTQPATTIPTAAKQELKVYMHSPLLYWWPVWAGGFVMALWTWLDNHHMILVPEHTAVEGNTVVAPPGTALEPPRVHMARSRVPGAVFVTTLLLVVVLNLGWLRGPWALFAAACVSSAIFLNSWLEWWEPLYRWLGLLHIHINLGGYLVIATVLFLVWALTVFVIDRRTYLVFSVGQVRVRDELGEAEKVYDTSHVAFEKRPYDWFRWLVGGGAGDMILRVGGPQPQTIELPNVVRVGTWLHEMEARLRTRDVV